LLTVSSTEGEKIQVIQASHPRDSADTTRREDHTSSRIRRIHTAPPGLSLTGTSERSFIPPITTRDFEPTTFLRNDKEHTVGENRQDVGLSRRAADVDVRDHEEFHALGWYVILGYTVPFWMCSLLNITSGRRLCSFLPNTFKGTSTNFVP
jgi:hypothetical protein